jgi:hypothetical protein
MQTQSASALFDTQAEAQRAVADLRAAGLPDSALSVVAKDGEGGERTALGNDMADEGHGSVLRGILGGGALGAGLGIAALAIPGVGPLVAAGAIAATAIPTAAAVGAAAGAAAGTLNETLVGHGIAEEDAGYYGDRIGHGGVLLAVDTQATTLSAEDVSDILYRNGGHNSARSRVSTY